MTGREFFSRFPELHSFLLSQLQDACQGINRFMLISCDLHHCLVCDVCPQLLCFHNFSKESSFNWIANAALINFTALLLLVDILGDVFYVSVLGVNVLPLCQFMLSITRTFPVLKYFPLLC